MSARPAGNNPAAEFWPPLTVAPVSSSPLDTRQPSPQSARPGRGSSTAHIVLQMFSSLSYLWSLLRPATAARERETDCSDAEYESAQEEEVSIK